MSDALERYKEAKKKMVEMQKEAQQVVQQAFKEATVELFDEHPELKSFGWNQYTPYFNDGDVCVFDTNFDWEVWINGLSSDEDINDDRRWDSGTSDWVPCEPHELRPLVKIIQEFLKTFSNDDYKDMFGDHVSVTVTRDSVETEHYEHE
jgi:hypothetical protein